MMDHIIPKNARVIVRFSDVRLTLLLSCSSNTSFGMSPSAILARLIPVGIAQLSSSVWWEIKVKQQSNVELTLHKICKKKNSLSSL